VLIVINILLWAIALPAAVACTVLFCECLIALIGTPRGSIPDDSPRPPLAVLIPAHDESLVITETIKIIQQQLTERDRLVVVADNCSDDTAELASECGAEVIRRSDPVRRGKGYALAFGIEHLAQRPPEVVVLMDADTHPQSGALDRLARMTGKVGRPTQAIYILDPPVNPRPRDLVSCFAFVIKNGVRPLGLARLGFPVPITGTGIGLPWLLAKSAPLKSGNIVEDMQLGIDLALRGTPPMLCPTARVMGRLPSEKRAARIQRTRWEHGHLQTLLRQSPRLMWRAIVARRPSLFVMAIDLAIPPLTLLLLLWFCAFSCSLLAAWQGFTSAPALITTASGLLFCVTILSCWARLFRHILPFRLLFAVPLYVVWKVPVYIAFLLRPQKEWVRTEREVVTN
jgi:cellulose synthase/poly-beta-1,6-N-acetylglucosamine synthase-like glycosyltransferase